MAPSVLVVPSVPEAPPAGGPAGTRAPRLTTDVIGATDDTVPIPLAAIAAAISAQATGGAAPQSAASRIQVLAEAAPADAPPVPVLSADAADHPAVAVLDGAESAGFPALPALSIADPAGSAPVPVPGTARLAGAGPPTGHRGRLRLVRRPLTLAVLVTGLAIVVGGTVGLSRLTGHPAQVPHPLAKRSAAPTGPFAAPPVHHSGHPVSPPVALVIPAIGVRTQLVHLGRTPQGTLAVPGSTAVAGWYTGSPRPGEIGSAIIAGHIDSTSGPAVFFRLRLLRAGNLVYVRRANGSLAVFRVYAEHMYTKAHFPTQQVYGPEPDAELHLITCGGVFDEATGSYLSNVVVYASEVSHRPPPHRRRHGHQPLARHS